MDNKEKTEFCKDILRLWHLVRHHGLLCCFYIDSAFAEFNVMVSFLGYAFEDKYLKYLWKKIEALWDRTHEAEENRQWKRQVLSAAYSGIYMMEPIDDLTAKIGTFLGEESHELVEWDHKLREKIGVMKDKEYDAFCEFIGLPVREEENDLFGWILPLECVITELFESETMREYLLDNMDSLSRWDIISMICCAAISLERKQELFMKLARGESYGEWRMDHPDDRETDGSYALYADSAEAILGSLTLKENEIFIVEMCWYDEEIKDEAHKIIGPAANYEKALQMISEVADDRDIMDEWFHLYKWEKDEEGNYIDKSYYVYACGEVMYCSWDESMPEGLSEEYIHDFGPYTELNLPTPFQLGDIVKIDCRPFAPVHHVLILENQWPEDCCSLQGLYVEADGYFSSGAVKHHSMIFPKGFWPNGSPLYRIEHVTHFIEGDELLLKVKEEIGGDPEKSFQLQKRIHERDTADME